MRSMVVYCTRKHNNALSRIHFQWRKCDKMPSVEETWCSALPSAAQEERVCVGYIMLQCIVGYRERRMYGVYLKCTFCRRKHKVVAAKSRNLEPVDTSTHTRSITFHSQQRLQPRTFKANTMTHWTVWWSVADLANKQEATWKLVQATGAFMYIFQIIVRSVCGAAV